jgi:DNA-binding CsgD family transcriptional regulator
MKLNTSEEFVEAMWSALIESPDFKPMIEAWDRALDDDDYAPEQNVKQLAAGMHGELARLEIALQAKVQAVKHDPALLRDHVDSYIKLAENKAIVSSSSAVATLKLDLEKLQLALHDIDFSVPGTHLVWGEEADGIDRHLLALTPVDASAPLPNTYLLKRLETDWPDAYDKILSSMFALCPAEIEILKDLYLGFESSAIAERRGRSVHTVRTQIKSIMEKIGVNNQRRLVRLLSTLFQLDASDGIRPATTDCYARHAFDLNQEQRLEYCEYGDPKGRVVVLITPTISPQPSPFIGKLALNNNLRVIAPFRPGSGLSSTRGSSDGPEAIAKDYFQLLDELGIEKAQVVGCDSGGL